MGIGLNKLIGLKLFLALKRSPMELVASVRPGLS